MPESVESIKDRSAHLRGHLYEEIYFTKDPGVSEESRQLLKFFGMYQHDDRDKRRARKAEGLSPDFRFMVRIALAGGRMTAPQYLAMDQLADEVGIKSLRLTSRQAVQLHGICKGNLPQLVTTLHHLGTTTLAGCGDVERNVMTCPAPDQGGIRDQLQAIVEGLSRQLKPSTGAYLELFVDGARVYDVREEEPLYGDTYLPRKFKTGFAVAGDNCTDIYSDDVGVVAHPGPDGKLSHFTLLVGGGLGHSNGVPRTRAFVGQPLGGVKPEELARVIETIMTVQRDHGNREDRRFARMKYLVESWGLGRFRAEVEARLGFSLGPAEDIAWEEPTDHLGWHAYGDGYGYLGIHVPNGRIQDTSQAPLKAVLRRVVAEIGPDMRITPQQNLLMLGLSEREKDWILSQLEASAIEDPATMHPVYRLGMACVALPTCGLALAESERVFPELLRDLEGRWVSLGRETEPLIVRMTGCPNNCVRTELAELGFVGASPGKYHVYLGGSRDGSRLAQKFLERVPFDELVPTVQPLLEAYHHEQQNAEGFGDWCVRVGLDVLRLRFEGGYLA